MFYFKFMIQEDTFNFTKKNKRYYNELYKAFLLLDSGYIEQECKGLHKVLSILQEASSQYADCDIELYIKGIADLFGGHSSLRGAMRYAIREKFSPKHYNRSVRYWLGLFIVLTFYSSYIFTDEKIILPPSDIFYDVLDTFKGDKKFYEQYDGVTIQLMHVTDAIKRSYVLDTKIELTKNRLESNYRLTQAIYDGLHACEQILRYLKTNFPYFDRVKYLFPYEEMFKRLLTLIEKIFGSLEEFTRFYNAETKGELAYRQYFVENLKNEIAYKRNREAVKNEFYNLKGQVRGYFNERVRLEQKLGLEPIKECEFSYLSLDLKEDWDIAQCRSAYNDLQEGFYEIKKWVDTTYKNLQTELLSYIRKGILLKSINELIDFKAKLKTCNDTERFLKQYLIKSCKKKPTVKVFDFECGSFNLDVQIKHERIMETIFNDTCDRKKLPHRYREIYDNFCKFDTYGVLRGLPIDFSDLDISDVYSFSENNLSFLREYGVDI